MPSELAKLTNATADVFAGKSGDATLNTPNAVTMAGFALGVWWVVGGPDWAAVASIIADEADGAIARDTGQTSEFGAELDFNADVVLTALTLRKLGVPWGAIPLVTAGQVALRNGGYKPPVLSLRAVLMLYAIIAKNKRKK